MVSFSLGIGAFLGCLITMVFYLTFTDAAPIVGSLIPLHDEYDVYGLGRGTYKIDNSGDLKSDKNTFTLEGTNVNGSIREDVLKKILKDNNIAIKNSAPAAVPVVPTPTNPNPTSTSTPASTYTSTPSSTTPVNVAAPFGSKILDNKDPSKQQHTYYGVM